MTEFYETKTRYVSATNCEYPISFEDWLKLPDDKKAAALYVNFFETIVLAYIKSTATCVEEQDLLSTLLQYLVKNVPVIKKDKRKYNGNYIYRVSYNAMAALRRFKGANERIDHYAPRYVQTKDGDEWDTFEIIEDERRPMTEQLEFAIDEIHAILAKSDATEIAVINHLLYDKKLSKRAEARYDEIVATLRGLLSKYKRDLLPDADIKFFDVIRHKELLESATVIMRDGEKAVFLGEIRKSDINSKTEYVFVGANRDYVLPEKVAGELRVVEEIQKEECSVKFAEIINCEDIVDSATVIMEDGVKATYLGEKRMSNITSKVEYVFFGPNSDYIVPEKVAKKLKVVSVELYQD